MKARTVPNRMVWVNGRGYQRAYSYRHSAAVAEMPVAFRSQGPSGQVLSVPDLTSRTAVYGPVRTVVWEGRSAMSVPIPIANEIT